jgi:hypothetical protein
MVGLADAGTTLADVMVAPSAVKDVASDVHEIGAAAGGVVGFATAAVTGNGSEPPPHAARVATMRVRNK